LQTINVWKGDPYETIVVNTGRGGGDCDITDMRVGSEWLVYANGDQDFLRTGICTLTKPLADASNDLAVLGAGDVPTLAGANESLPHSNSGWLLGLCTAVVAFLVAAFLIFRRRSQPDANYG
jgi:hypothetical protein